MMTTYERCYNLLKDLSKQEDIRTVLEIGCHCGSFVHVLTNSGYDAYGVDPNTNAANHRIYAVGAEDMSKVFGSFLFDAVVMSRVTSTNAALSTAIQKIGLGYTQNVDWKYMRKTSRANALTILEAAIAQIKFAKYLIAVEDVQEDIGFSADDAEDLGYVVRHYDEHTAILQRPGSN